MLQSISIYLTEIKPLKYNWVYISDTIITRYNKIIS